MGIKNFLIEGVSGTGKTSVGEELQKRGFHVVHGDRELKYFGNPQTGNPLNEPGFSSEWEKTSWRHKHLLWDIDKVMSEISDQTHEVTFFCGGCRNAHYFTAFLDGVFILEVEDIETLYKRLDERVARDPSDFGGKPEEKELVSYYHETKEDLPKLGMPIDASEPLENVIHHILLNCDLT
jgi:hypothetical protein